MRCGSSRETYVWIPAPTSAPTEFNPWVKLLIIYTDYRLVCFSEVNGLLSGVSFEQNKMLFERKSEIAVLANYIRETNGRTDRRTQPTALSFPQTRSIIN